MTFGCLPSKDLNVTDLATTTGAVPCATHPDTETVLRCGRCEKPICPKCLVYTPVGTRCRQCANVKRLPTFNVSREEYLRAIGVGIAVAFGIGLVWGLVLSVPFVGRGFFGLIVAGAAGYGIGEVISQTVNRRQGRPLEIIAGLATLLGLVNAFLLPDLGALLLRGVVPSLGIILLGYAGAFMAIFSSIFTLVALLIAVVVAVSRFR